MKEEPKMFEVASVEDDSDMNVSYEIEHISDSEIKSTPINVRMKRVLRQKPKKLNVSSFLAGTSGEDSKDINDFAIVKNYKKNMKKIR